MEKFLGYAFADWPWIAAYYKRKTGSEGNNLMKMKTFWQEALVWASPRDVAEIACVIAESDVSDGSYVLQMIENFFSLGARMDIQPCEEASDEAAAS